MRAGDSKSPDRIDDILGRVRTCARCSEEWPVTEEFWYRDGHDPDRWFRGPCRACYLEEMKKYAKKYVRVTNLGDVDWRTRPRQHRASKSSAS